MLKKPHRLAKTKDVQRVLARGRGFFNPLFTIKVAKGSDETKKLFTVIVSAKVAKRAVVRNRLKRILREVIRLNLGKINPGGYAVVVKAPAVAATRKELAERFTEFLYKNKIIKN